MTAKHQPGVFPHRYWTVEAGQAAYAEGAVIEEALVGLYVNGQEVATVMCSPVDQEALALGFIYNEGIISSLAEVGLVKANVARTIVDIFLKRSDFDPPRRLIITSGCGGGVTLQVLTETFPALDSVFATTPDTIFARMRDLQGAAQLYNAVRGVHTAVLANTERVLVSGEDVGRHNAIDKVAGKVLQAGIDSRDCLLLTSGRISSEMLSKARRLNVPLVASRTAPTSITVQLAEAWNICVVGYVRQGTLRVYTHPERLGLPPVT